LKLACQYNHTKTVRKKKSFSFDLKMHRSQQSRKRYHSSSFIKFVARIQHTFSSKNIKSSTPVIQQQQQQLSRQTNSTPVSLLLL
jgi:hypothetical protein